MGIFCFRKLPPLSSSSHIWLTATTCQVGGWRSGRIELGSHMNGGVEVGGGWVRLKLFAMVVASLLFCFAKKNFFFFRMCQRVTSTMVETHQMSSTDIL